MKKQNHRKLSLPRETLKDLTDPRRVTGGGSENRACAGYTEVIGPCVPTQGGSQCG